MLRVSALVHFSVFRMLTGEDRYRAADADERGRVKNMAVSH